MDDRVRTVHWGLRVGALGLLLAIVSLPSVARADVLVLKDGRIIEREKMARAEKGIEVHFENGVIVVPHAAIEDAVLSEPPPSAEVSEEDQAKLAEGLVRYKGRWIKKERFEGILAKELEARREEVAKLKHHSLWRNRHKTTTKHFKFEYTVAPFVYEYYEEVMEAYYKAFAKAWKVKQPKDLGKLVVCFYTDRKAFHRTGGAPRGALGYFRFVKPLELNFYYNRVDPEQTEQVMYHEANHYLQKLLDPEFSMPHFPGESIAEYYGSSRYDPETKKLTTGHILDGRLTEVKTDIARGEMMDLKAMILADGMYQHYTWGWTLAHFLMNDKRYAKNFKKFVKGLAFDKKVARVPQQSNLKTVVPAEVYRYFVETLKLEDDAGVKALEAEWHDYIQNTLKSTSSRGLELAADSASRVGRPIRAKRLYREAIEAGSERPQTFFGYGELLRRDGKISEAIKMFRKAIELEPLEAEFYAELGRALVRNGDKDEGNRYMKLALELDPDDPWLAFNIDQFIEDND